MRIALLNSLFPPLGIGGAEESTLHLARGLQALGHAVTVIGENTEDRRIEETVEGVPVIRLASPPGQGPNILDRTHYTRYMEQQGRAESTTVVERALRELADLAPHVVHTAVFGQLPQLWTGAAESGAALVHTLRNYNLLCHRRMMRQEGPCTRQCQRCRQQRLRNRPAGDLLDAVAGISGHVLSVHLEAGWFGRTRHRAVIANGYSLPEGTLPAQGRPDFDIGYIGRLHPTKGVEPLMEAVAALRGEGRSVRLLVAGTGNPDYEAHLQGLDPHPDTIFAGYMDKADFFPKVRFCAVPSVWFEPFGRVYIEALHHGVPVIGSIRGGGPEVITHGRDGFLCAPDAAALARTLRQALDLAPEGLAAMRSAALDAAPRFSTLAVAGRYVDLYRKALAE